ncbi:putative ribonuclease H-like domain-containing protein [Tanacetum coccineum]
MFDSGCSRNMTGNKALLTDYQDIDGGFVAFGGSTRGEENVSTQQYIVFPLWSSISSSYKSSDDKAKDYIVDDACRKTAQEPASEYDQALKNVLDKMMDQEKEALIMMSAFLYGTIEEEVYVCQPTGSVDLEFPEKVYKVEKALYGLH